MQNIVGTAREIIYKLTELGKLITTTASSEAFQ